MITGSPDAVEPDEFSIEDDTVHINLLTTAPIPSPKQLTDLFEACCGDIFVLLQSLGAKESEYEKALFTVNSILAQDEQQRVRFDELSSRFNRAAMQLSGRRAIGEMQRFNYAAATTSNVISMIKYCLEPAAVAKPKEIGQTEPVNSTISGLMDAVSKELPSD